MNKLKSRYVIVFLMVAMVIAGYSVYAIIDPLISGAAVDWAWLGAAFTVWPFMIFLSRAFFLEDVPRTSKKLPIIVILAALGVLFAVLAKPIGLGEGLVPVAAAIVGFATFLLYDFWYSRFGRGINSQIRVGSPLPDFELEDENGAKVVSASFIGSPSLLMFFRGNWCPFCMAQIKEIAAQYRQLSDHGVTVALVSPQPHKQMRKLAAKFDVPFRFLVDPDLKASSKLEVAMPNGVPMGFEGIYGKDTVLPTVIITDAEGVVRFVDQTDNYRVRPEPQSFLGVFDEMGLGKPTALAS